MRYLFHHVVGRALNRVQARLVRSRSGSVLILVVVLVVLLALMGTALLSTTRGDRYVAAQHTVNTQVDLLVEGLVQISKATIIDDIYGTSHKMRPVEPPTGTYDNWDAYDVSLNAGTQNDSWLASRWPSWTGKVPYWPAITKLTSVPNFDSPYAIISGNNANNGASTIPVYTDHVTAIVGTGPSALPRRFTPTAIKIGDEGETFPAWYLEADNTVPTIPARYVIAADADGDGIADSGLFRLPVPEIDGITYFGAVRIIDNNSAININTALSQDTDFDITSGAHVDTFGSIVSNSTLSNNLGAFRSHVGLRELLNGGTEEFDALVKYRTNNAAGSISTVDEAGAPRGDFTYVTVGDALEYQARHVGDGATAAAIAPLPSTTRYQPISLSESGRFAYHFILPPAGTKSQIENYFFKSVTNNGTSAFDSLLTSSGNYKATFRLAQPDKFPALGRDRYSPDQADRWYDDNFNFDGLQQPTFNYPSLADPRHKDFSLYGDSSPYQPGFRRPLRSVLTAYNPVSNAVPVPTAVLPPVLAGKLFRSSNTPLKGNPIKADLNTAPFEDLWRNYWCVMVNELGDTPFVRPVNITNDGPFQGMEFDSQTNASTGTINNQHMFRSSLRDPRGVPQPFSYFLNKDQIVIRAAAAAVQTVQMRSPETTETIVKEISNFPIQGELAGAGVRVTLYGYKPQPFITEIIAWSDKDTPDPASVGGPNNVPYVAIELYNPNTQPITLDNTWHLMYLSRQAGNWQATIAAAEWKEVPFNGSVTIPPNGFVVIENFVGAGSGTVEYRPGGITIPTGVSILRVDGLEQILDNEFTLVHELPVTGNMTTLTAKQPIDSYDFTGFPSTAASHEGHAWHYVRNTDNKWGFVYPGRYFGGSSKIAEPRQQGSEFTDWAPDGTPQGAGPWSSSIAMKAPPTLGAPNTVSLMPQAFQIPLGGDNSPGPNKITTGSGNKFPFGGFARVGDILQVPFIASYMITDNIGQNLVDYNAITMDAAFAEDGDARDDPTVVGAPQNQNRYEQVGRFSPVRITVTPEADVPINDLDVDYSTYDETNVTPAQNASMPPPQRRYFFARNLFDYFTVQSPASDYVPNVSPLYYTPKPIAVKNGAGPAADEDDPNISPTNQGKEDGIGVQGLININTAPWPVLAAIPWVPHGQLDKFAFDPGTGILKVGTSDTVDDNIDIAKAIVSWRDGNPEIGLPSHGPFKSIYDLNSITRPGSINASEKYLFDFIEKTMYQAEPGVPEGDFTGQDGVRYDAKEINLLFTKVSNLLTTRSDSFTVYILIQGWRLPAPGSDTKPERVVERRAAFIQDRSTITAANPAQPAAVNIPND